ncbi:hypothetical protein SAMN05518672_10240 [Chitinophaga sp. CF118]|uniref:DUF1415 domain-containing protein n=1 Tax=Chitinophaga sp. CF118 TaxID=1884367 RepID=UPI0008EDF93D|nr:DUF1415 domain-containing protein [Chitinophaga sp. CF118]SFD46112.1 hypothetical protein SAMN05518672_10240 [Chitinophaga sp. CF118]
MAQSWWAYITFVLMTDDLQVISQTKNWIRVLVVGCNFCPFASKVAKQESIHYRVENATTSSAGKDALLEECRRLDEDPSIATTLLIFPDAFPVFDQYLDFVFTAEKMMRQKGYDGTYQLASFHPLYQFAETALEDPANYTNRSIYPMLHLLREDDITKALERYPNSSKIPENNINFARSKGEAYMKMLRDSCL